ncbi:hypothetical protein QTP70_007248 [Hemibagrus guttatus]|uniref:Uncharacterized protein n=1 Tax=Hemibagrus guttatus TaxID=175788 RepID=A0AAE0UQL9_9TELE|nr:hypothetical protein QTP70_007248 [Hemibagrus guttatus]
MFSLQEHSETQLLRKRARDLDTEYKQLQLDYQEKDSRVLALEKEVESLQKLRCTEQEADALLSALSSLQDKAQHLEYNLSAETRLKLDLFSALGDARRQLEIAQVKLLKQDQEIKEMKQKIAEVMAVSPGVSYVAPRSTVPQYLKFLNSERYVLNPREKQVAATQREINVHERQATISATYSGVKNNRNAGTVV